MTIQDLRTNLEQQKGKKQGIEQRINDIELEIKRKSRDRKNHEEALEIVKAVGLKTQQQLQYHISNITSMALEAVFVNPYKLEIEFVENRNKTECNIYFVRNGSKIDPRSASGGGAVDVAAFALRLACWSMKNPKNRNVIILDEPFKHLKGKEANLKVLDMVNQISKTLGLQIIMVSDERIDRDDIIAKSDKVFECSISKEITKITEL